MKYEVKKIIFQNQENGWTVAKCKDENGFNQTLTGVMPGIEDGCIVKAEGKIVNSKYGEQLSVERYILELPHTEKGIYNYLRSNHIKGIGEKYAKLIVDYFKTDTLNIIEKDYMRLTEVKGIGTERALKIYNSFLLSQNIKDLIMFLQQYDISTSLADRIYKRYGENSQKIIEENPYHLTNIWGIGFKTADKIAMALGFSKNCEIRCQSGLIYTIKELESEGHCYVSRKQLIKEGNKILEVNPDILDAQINILIEQRRIENEDDCLYLPATLDAEKYVAYKLTRLNEYKKEKKFDMNRIKSLTPLNLAPEQENAIKVGNEEKIMILTGGPGTGKTTITNAIIKSLEEDDETILLAAPTGRAAKRMSEVCHKPAKTIHRLLGYGCGDDGGFFYKEGNPLRCTTLIVDECSMIDIYLMSHLLQALSLETKLILVGDADQLPSVGAGNVLRDIINSGAFPVVKLDKIFRQGEESGIINLAHNINKKKHLDLEKKFDFRFLPCDNPETNADFIYKLYSEYIPDKFGISSDEIQILTPMRKGSAGTNILNELIQDKFNDNEICYETKIRKFKIHDKVMQIKNDYSKDIYNGDIGFVVDVNKEDSVLIVQYDDKYVSYEFNELDEITLAYACTIHKSQGSEYSAVIMPITSGQWFMLQKNLIYTGVTRAKQLLIIVGEEKYLRIGCKNTKQLKRNTKLQQRLEIKRNVCC